MRRLLRILMQQHGRRGHESGHERCHLGSHMRGEHPHGSPHLHSPGATARGERAQRMTSEAVG